MGLKTTAPRLGGLVLAAALSAGCGESGGGTAVRNLEDLGLAVDVTDYEAFEESYLALRRRMLDGDAEVARDLVRDGLVYGMLDAIESVQYRQNR